MEKPVQLIDIPYEPGVKMIDLMRGNSRIEAKVLDQGFVALIDVMPRLVPQGRTADYAIARAARVSYGVGTKRVSEDEGLIRYLMRHRHTTPFEMVEFQFHAKMPIFVARQWIRHRTANVNEYSGRYSIMPDEFYRPEIEDVRTQSNSNKQGGGKSMDEQTAEEFLDFLTRTEQSYNDYKTLTGKGVARELARIGLPQSIYTQWYWKIDLHNLLHFLGLRMDSHAQFEIRKYANAMFEIIEPIVPISCKAFMEYQHKALHLSALEVKAERRIRAGESPRKVIASVFQNNRERKEFSAKRRRLK